MLFLLQQFEALALESDIVVLVVLTLMDGEMSAQQEYEGKGRIGLGRNLSHNTCRPFV